MSYGGGTFQAAYLPTFFNPISGKYLECTGLFLDVFKKFLQMAPEKTLAAQFSRSGNTRAGNPRWGNVYQSNSKQGKFSRRGNFRCGTFFEREVSFEVLPSLRLPNSVQSEYHYLWARKPSNRIFAVYTMASRDSSRQTNPGNSRKSRKIKSVA